MVHDTAQVIKELSDINGFDPNDFLWLLESWGAVLVTFLTSVVAMLRSVAHMYCNSNHVRTQLCFK